MSINIVRIPILWFFTATGNLVTLERVEHCVLYKYRYIINTGPSQVLLTSTFDGVC